MECLFCDIITGKKPGFFIYEDEICIAILDKYPIDFGHALVITKKHYEQITDMPNDMVGELFSKIPSIAKSIISITKADAFSIGQNNGKAAKQIVPHVHIHIIPRYQDKGTIWTKRGIADDAELKDLSEKNRKHSI